MLLTIRGILNRSLALAFALVLATLSHRRSRSRARRPLLDNLDIRAIILQLDRLSLSLVLPSAIGATLSAS